MDGAIYGQNSQDMFGGVSIGVGKHGSGSYHRTSYNRTCLGELALASGDTALSVITVP